jgi:hypothetical protein
MSIMRTLAFWGGGTIVSGGSGATGGVVVMTTVVVAGWMLTIYLLHSHMCTHTENIETHYYCSTLNKC